MFHAAALKHLPLLEMHPSEAVKTNVWGTQNVLDAAAAPGVERFVNISTDKAADPMQRARLHQAHRRAAHRAGRAHDTDGTYLSVRFGNVLGSRGSVLTAFHAQIEAGGPITVTDPDVTRYFMTVEEAVQLVIQAGAIGRDGEALVLDMGEPVRIADVARRLVAESDRPIEIVYTGLRPGEKLHEVLLGADEIDGRPAHPLISHVQRAAPHRRHHRGATSPDLDDAGLLVELRRLARAGSTAPVDEQPTAPTADCPRRVAGPLTADPVSTDPTDPPGRARPSGDRRSAWRVGGPRAGAAAASRRGRRRRAGAARSWPSGGARCARGGRRSS